MLRLKKAETPLGGILLAADDEGLTGLWFLGQQYFPADLSEAAEDPSCPVFTETEHWLEAYFAGECPPVLPPLHMKGSPFRLAVWAILREIPYGGTTTYGTIAAQLAQRTGKRVSAQAVGGAVGHNPISILVPCHRVIGADGSLTGYAGGLERKQALLRLEQESVKEKGSGLFLGSPFGRAVTAGD